ncbi:MAG: pilus assembly protein [Planctomycetes bacterium]|nr:pilus assembly protein [Planctomycetota bacterium]
MNRETLIACLPYIGGIVGLLLCQAVVIRLSGARVRWAQLKQLHADQAGAAQSLSFVLTFPLFLFVMMFVVQLCLITMARISVEYAAFAAARSAMVWISANLGDEDYAENRVGPPIVPVRQYEANGRNYTVYQLIPTGEKFAKIHLAAAMACLPICPSGNKGVEPTHPGNAALPSIERAYVAMAPDSVSNLRIPSRLRNKLAYALANTWIAIEVHHCGDQISGGDPPLYPEMPLQLDFPSRYLRPNEIGWQDQIYVTVAHDYALIPGAGRLLTNRTSSSINAYAAPKDDVRLAGNVYVRTLMATARLGNEGQKAAPTISGYGGGHRSYVHPLPW